MLESAAAKLGVPSPPPFMSVSMNDEEVLGGVNYASGGAGILNETGAYFVINFLISYFNSASSTLSYWLIHVNCHELVCLTLQVQKLSFDDQIICFQKTKDVITLKIGEKPSEKLCNEALFLVGLGIHMTSLNSSSFMNCTVDNLSAILFLKTR